MEKFERITGIVVPDKRENEFYIHDDACLICGSLGMNESKVLDMINRVNQNDNTMRLLKKLEWSVIADFGNNSRCPLCKELKTNGHKKDCELGLLLTKKQDADAIFCETRIDGNCSTRDYGPSEYKEPCCKCCLGCKGSVEMSCSFVCNQVAEHYYPDMESEG
jgi:hypothetical protein